MLSCEGCKHMESCIDSLMRHQAGYREQPPSIFQSITRPDIRSVQTGPEVLGVGAQRHNANLDLTITKPKLSKYGEA
jgi:hypothetical protein